MDVRDHLFIGGEWVAPSSTSTIDAVCASTEEVFGRVPAAADADVDRAVASARRAFDEGPWPAMSPAERAVVLNRLVDGLERRGERIARLVSMENGQELSRSRIVQAMAPVMASRATIGLADQLEVREVRQGLVRSGLVLRVPVGVVGAIVPWNAPLFLTLVKMVPALLAGCTVVVKAAPETPLDAYELADACAEADFPAGVVNVLVGGPEAGRALVEHRGVDKIAFTGSTETGKWIMGRCAETLKRVTLELGGKSAGILLDDVDLDRVLPMLAERMTVLSGQVCGTLTRILVPRSRAGEITDGLCDYIRTQRVGDPFDETTVMGPLVSARQRERVEGYIRLGEQEGGKVVLGGGRPAGLERGWYVEPTVFVNVDNRFRVAQEEIFGPVWCIIPYDGDDEAVRIANDSPYGLAGAVFTSDPGRGGQVAERLRAGLLGVNGTAVDPLLPYGGFKQSGIGREQGIEGLHEYVETKVLIDLTA